MTRTLSMGLLFVLLASEGGRSSEGHVDRSVLLPSHPSLTSAFALPTSATIRPLLEGAVHTSEFVHIPAGGARILAFVSYPDRADRAPVVMVTTGRGMSDWARTLAFQAARAGFVAIAPDYLTGLGPGGGDADAFMNDADVVDALNRASESEMIARTAGVRAFAAELPAASGVTASLDMRAGRIAATVESDPPRFFAQSDTGWADALTYLAHRTGSHAVPHGGMDHVAMELRAAQAGAGAAREAPGLNVKPDDLPANWVMAEKVANTTPRRNEWLDVPMPGSRTTIRTWAVYPDGNQPVGAVLVLHGASGLTDWIRGVADQLAQDGFLALAVDLSSGLGPGGGNFDAFRFMDDRMRATQKLSRDEVMGRIKAVRDYAAKMPRSNGRTGSIGFCGGGTNSFTLATDVAAHNASVVYYGGPPPAASLVNAVAPVLGFYGEDDARIFSTVAPTRAAMQKLGKSYEAHTYSHTTHSFLWMQDLGNNFAATADAWPRTIAFFRRHLNAPPR